MDAEAVEAYKKTVQITPADTRFFYRLARAHFKLGRWEEVKIGLEQATELEPDNPDHYFFLSLAYHNLGQDQKGKEAFGKTLNLAAEQIPSTDTPEWVNWVVNKVIEKFQRDE